MQNSTKKSVSPFFYIVFGITLFAFLGLLGYIVLRSREVVSLHPIRSAKSQIQEFSLLSESDETTDIEKDIQNSDFSSLDREMTEIEIMQTSE